jgi:hypothetical protein
VFGKHISIANLLLNNQIRMIRFLQNVYLLDENAWMLDNWEFTVLCHFLASTKN